MGGLVDAKLENYGRAAVAEELERLALFARELEARLILITEGHAHMWSSGYMPDPRPRRDERRLIVAWLRGPAKALYAQAPMVLDMIANDIARGEHHKKAENE